MHRNQVCAFVSFRCQIYVNINVCFGRAHTRALAPKPDPMNHFSHVHCVSAFLALSAYGIFLKWMMLDCILFAMEHSVHHLQKGARALSLVIECAHNAHSAHTARCNVLASHENFVRASAIKWAPFAEKERKQRTESTAKRVNITDDNKKRKKTTHQEKNHKNNNNKTLNNFEILCQQTRLHFAWCHTFERDAHTHTHGRADEWKSLRALQWLCKMGMMRFVWFVHIYLLFIIEVQIMPLNQFVRCSFHKHVVDIAATHFSECVRNRTNHIRFCIEWVSAASVSVRAGEWW